MKANATHRRVRHPAPAKKHARTKKRVRATVAPAKKEATAPVATEPRIVETAVATFQEPVEFMVMVPEPDVDVIEVFEVTVHVDVGEV